MNAAELSSTISGVLLVGLVVGIPLYGCAKGTPVYESFVQGAGEGFGIAVRLIPYLVAIMTAVGMARASGFFDLTAEVFPDVVKRLGLESEVIALIMVRPFSGSASLGLLGDTAAAYGADSLPARLAGVIMGSTETTFYVIAVYFGAVHINRVRYAAHAGLLADAAGVIAAIAVVKLFFG